MIRSILSTIGLVSISFASVACSGAASDDRTEETTPMLWNEWIVPHAEAGPARTSNAIEPADEITKDAANQPAGRLPIWVTESRPTSLRPLPTPDCATCNEGGLATKPEGHLPTPDCATCNEGGLATKPEGHLPTPDCATCNEGGLATKPEGHLPIGVTESRPTSARPLPTPDCVTCNEGPLAAKP